MIENPRSRKLKSPKVVEIDEDDGDDWEDEDEDGNDRPIADDLDSDFEFNLDDNDALRNTCLVLRKCFAICLNRSSSIRSLSLPGGKFRPELFHLFRQTPSFLGHLEPLVVIYHRGIDEEHMDENGSNDPDVQDFTGYNIADF